VYGRYPNRAPGKPRFMSCRNGHLNGSDMDSGMKEVGSIIMTGVGHGIGGRMRSHSFSDSTSRVPNSNCNAFQRRNTLDIIDNQATSRQTSSSSTEEKCALLTISSTADLSSLSLQSQSASDTENQVTESASEADALEHERTQCNIRQLTHQLTMSCANP